jgi:hypothetical protein
MSLPSSSLRPGARRLLRRLAPFAALAAAAILAGCETPAPAPSAPPPPPPPPPPAMAMSSKLIDLAGIYRGYVDRANAISPGFTDPASVAQGLKTGSAYEPKQLMRGAIAYGAIAALQSPEFVAGARKYVGDTTQRRQVAYEILKDPAYAVGLPGSAQAAGLVMKALGEDAQHLYDQGKAVKQAAYDIQKSPWSKADVAGRDARMAQAKEVSTVQLLAETAQTSRLTQAFTGATPLGLTSSAASPPYTPLVIRSLAIAALAALGNADDASLEQILPLMNETNGANCLNLAKLNLYQCLAVARPNYEDVFCLGEHIMMDTGRCLLKSTGLQVPPEAHFVPTADMGRPYVAPGTKAPAKKKAAPKKK